MIVKRLKCGSYMGGYIRGYINGKPYVKFDSLFQGEDAKIIDLIMGHRQ